MLQGPVNSHFEDHRSVGRETVVMTIMYTIHAQMKDIMSRYVGHCGARMFHKAQGQPNSPRSFSHAALYISFWCV